MARRGFGRITLIGSLIDQAERFLPELNHRSCRADVIGLDEPLAVVAGQDPRHQVLPVRWSFGLAAEYGGALGHDDHGIAGQETQALRGMRPQGVLQRAGKRSSHAGADVVLARR